jgi:hypothetical protein
MKFETGLKERGKIHYENYINEVTEVDFMDQVFPHSGDSNQTQTPDSFDINENKIHLRSLLKSSEVLTKSLMSQDSIAHLLKASLGISWETPNLQMVTWHQYLQFKSFIDYGSMNLEGKKSMWINIIGALRDGQGKVPRKDIVTFFEGMSRCFG